VNQIPDKNVEMFLNLLNGQTTSSNTTLSGQDLQESLRTTLLDLRQPYRAVTPQDYEQLTLIDWHQTETAKKLGNGGRVQRVKCLPQVNLTSDQPKEKTFASAHISLVILPEKQDQDSNTLKYALWNFLDQRRLLTTQLHVVEPEYVEVTITTTLKLKEGVTASGVRPIVYEAIQTFFDPRVGGAQQQGWPFGRDVYISELYTLLDLVPEVDYVEALNLKSRNQEDESATQTNTNEKIEVKDHQLVKVTLEKLILKESWEA
jgi:hypothetical protein